MSEFAVSRTAPAATGADTAESHPVPQRSAAISIAHEAYAFACMRCGHGWEQSYEIEHHVDGDGAEFVMYVADGEHVPSPLTRPTCLNCGGHVVRIMRAGQVSSVSSALAAFHTRRPAPVTGDGAAEVPEQRERHHWHLSDLLHPFSHHKKEA
ncbi:hypothetical protein AB0J38_36215 [Streptomyces sp. NPDC050095]|uniref:hypothetical protein n=1 Tax=unclassified Streptomyces TaxID=2593676 RepID=UPI00343134D9